MMPKYFRGEKEDINTVVGLGEKWGYGNLIYHLQKAWSDKLRLDGIDRYGADMASGLICAWCNIDHRTGKKARKGYQQNGV